MKMKRLLRAVLAVSVCFALVLHAGMFASAEEPTEITLTLDTKSYFVRSVAVRLADTEYDSGVRFKTVITKAAFEAQLQDENGAMNPSVKTWTVLIPSGNLSGDLTAETAGAKVIETTDIWKEVEYNGVAYYESTVYVYDIPEAYYGSDITVRSYVQYGDEAPIYTAAKSASMAFVADAAVNSSSESLTDEQKTSLKDTYLTYQLTYTMGEETKEETIYYKDLLTEYLPSGVLVWTNTAGTAVWNLQDTVTGDMKLKTTYTEGLTGAGTETDPYIIDSQADLEQLSVACRNGNTFNEKYFQLGVNNLEANQQISVHTTSDGKGGFCGGFDGDNHSIKVTLEGDTYVGLFGQLGTAGVVKNLTVTGTVSSTGSAADMRSGAVAGIAYGTIQHCTNQATVQGKGGYIGGIAGYAAVNSTIDQCINEGGVTAEKANSGGIAGYVNNPATVSNCKNEGAVSGTTAVGGIVGYVNGNANAETNTIVLSGNENNGTVTGTSYRVGGIVGVSTSMVLIDTCTNNGSVEGTGNTTSNQGGVGGIAGAVYDTDINGCVNGETAVITNSGMATGGIVGYINKNGVEITDCHNNAAITEDGAYVGGIVGYTAYDTVIENCDNTGSIIGNTTSAYSYGGIAGAMISGGTIQSCNNEGVVKGRGNSTGNVPGGVGGIVGTMYASTVKLCENKGTISNDYTCAGGIVGLIYKDKNPSGDAIIEECKNYASIQAENQGAGGIVGFANVANNIVVQILNCDNGSESSKADITGKAYAGGIIGNLGTTSTDSQHVIKGCKNFGDIVATGSVTVNNAKSARVGGIAGMSYGNITSCSSSGSVTAKEISVTATDAIGTSDNYRTGKIVGYQTKACTLTECTFE